MACCSRCKNFESSAQYNQQLSRKLSEIEKIFPGTSSTLIINSESEPPTILYPINKKKEQNIHQELLNVCGRLQVFLSNFAQTIGEEKCSSVHIRGNTHLFSFYIIGSIQLVFYSEMSDNLEYFKVSADKDDRMKQILEDLQIQIDLL